MQTTRINCLRAWEALPANTPFPQKQRALSDLLVILFHSVSDALPLPLRCCSAASLVSLSLLADHPA